MRRARAWLPFAVVAVGFACACSTFRTTSLVDQFNGGVLGADPGDPRRAPKSRQREIVEAVVGDGFEDAYFTQGERVAGGRCSIAFWLDKDAQDRRLSDTSTQYVQCATTDAGTKQQATAKVTRDDLLESLAPADGWCDGAAVPQPSCDASGALRNEVWADWVRFTVARRRTAQRLSELLVEGLVSQADVDAYLPDALHHAARYLRMRRWKRSTTDPTRALVVKGGAGTGIYSAGAVWAVLQMINEGDRWLALSGRPQHDHRFRMMSGTSTGALVSSAVDIFNTASTYEERWKVIWKLGVWFTCYGSGDLYCVQNAPATAMLEQQRGLLRFDGIRRLLEQNLRCADAENGSELVLNTVDFRRGRLFDFSDQNRLELVTTADVRNAVLASAELPFIVEPERHMPVDGPSAVALGARAPSTPGVDGPSAVALGARAPSTPGVDGTEDRGDHAYLDGGIRSELPVIPVARRGAERVLVVSSAASLTPEIGPLPNGLSIATRYIDVTLGGITESERDHAQRMVESLRQEEIRRCDLGLAADPIGARAVEAFCSGRWSEVCRTPKTATTPAPAAPEDELSALWRTESLFRNEELVPGIPGYAFDTEEFMRMFRAGAEAVRQRCKAIADLVFGDEAAEVLGLRGFCAPAVPESFCPGTAPSASKIPDCPAKDDPGEAKTCAE